MNYINIIAKLQDALERQKVRKGIWHAPPPPPTIRFRSDSADPYANSCV